MYAIEIRKKTLSRLFNITWGLAFLCLHHVFVLLATRFGPVTVGHSTVALFDGLLTVVILPQRS